MSTRDTGGPAFPRHALRIKLPDGSVVPHEPGMTLRDYFAAKALSGWYAGTTTLPANTHLRAYAADFYAIADAMLQERAK